MCPYTPQSSSRSNSSSALPPREVASPAPPSWESDWPGHCTSGAQALFYSSLWDGNPFRSLSGALEQHLLYNAENEKSKESSP